MAKITKDLESLLKVIESICSVFCLMLEKRLKFPEIGCLSKKIKYIDEQIENNRKHDKQFEELQEEKEQLENELDRLRW